MRHNLLLAVLFAAALPLAAQPYNAWLVRSSTSTTGYVEIPHSSAFNFSTGFTFEAWVNGNSGGGCQSIAGKGWTQTWWVGVCGTSLRSYIKGSASVIDGGQVAPNDWVHIAVTYDGANRKHYVDGELVKTNPETGAMPTDTLPVRLDNDVAYDHTYGSLDEVRIWNVALTQDQIRANINRTITTPQPGLVAVYHLDGSAVDSIGGHNGTLGGSLAYLNAPVTTAGCGATTSTQLCLASHRFAVTSKWQLADGTTGVGTVVPGSSDNSGLFWFFGPDNWEVLVKVLDGCTVNSNKWVFSAATTNQHYELVVTDTLSGATRRYLNYFGPPAPAVTDVTAFNTCP
jgi:Concanavalin A-like lectin/glucanases superfamily